MYILYIYNIPYLNHFIIVFSQPNKMTDDIIKVTFLTKVSHSDNERNKNSVQFWQKKSVCIASDKTCFLSKLQNLCLQWHKSFSRRVTRAVIKGCYTSQSEWIELIQSSYHKPMKRCSTWQIPSDTRRGESVYVNTF